MFNTQQDVLDYIKNKLRDLDFMEDSYGMYGLSPYYLELKRAPMIGKFYFIEFSKIIPPIIDTHTVDYFTLLLFSLDDIKEIIFINRVDNFINEVLNIPEIKINTRLKKVKIIKRKLGRLK